MFYRARRTTGRTTTRVFGLSIILLFLASACGRDISPDVTPPATITDLVAEPDSGNALTLTWTAPGDDAFSGTVSRYDLRYSTTLITRSNFDSLTESILHPVPVRGDSIQRLRLDDLQPYTRYFAAIRSVDDANNVSQLSNVASAVTQAGPDTIPPAVITDLRVIAVTAAGIGIAWTAPGDDGAFGRASSYDIRYAAGELAPEDWGLAEQIPGVPVPRAGGLPESLSITPLDTDTQYYFAIRTRDESGNISVFSAPVSERTLKRTTPRTWKVRQEATGDVSTIQAGIDSAAAGDRVLVWPGTYREHINFKGKNIELTSLDGPDVTIIDGEKKPGSVVLFANGETNDAYLHGFTITRGIGSQRSGGSLGGGGIHIQDAEPVIIANIIVDNGYTDLPPGGNTLYGGGVYIESLATTRSWSPVIYMNTIVNNRAMTLGGGLAALDFCSPRVYRNTIRSNRSGCDGGGAYVAVLRSETLFLDNVVSDNVAGDHGGGLYIGDKAPDTIESTFTVAQNIVARNTAGANLETQDTGAGIYLVLANAVCERNTIVLNTTASPASMGGGIQVSGGHPLISKNIIAFSGEGGGMVCLRNSSATIQNNLFWMNIGGDGGGECSGIVGTLGNVALDPRFCDLDRGYGLSIDSPAFSHPEGPLGAAASPECEASSIMESRRTGDR